MLGTRVRVSHNRSDKIPWVVFALQVVPGRLGQICCPCSSFSLWVFSPVMGTLLEDYTNKCLLPLAARESRWCHTYNPSVAAVGAGAPREVRVDWPSRQSHRDPGRRLSSPHLAQKLDANCYGTSCQRSVTLDTFR
jgi:hypothetical protein